MEIWRDVPCYVGQYQVSDQGRVRSLDRLARDKRRVKGKILTPWRGGAGGYLTVSLRRYGWTCQTRVHVLVLEAFVGPRPTPDAEAMHDDHDKLNCRLSNLSWGSRSANTLARKHDPDYPRSKFRRLSANDVRRIKALLRAGKTHASIGARFNVTAGAISHISTKRNHRDIQEMV